MLVRVNSNLYLFSCLLIYFPFSFAKKVIAHEIAHSWTGNLVTNHTWEHFWLNEGWTVWLERKIAAKIHGPEYLNFSAQIGYKHLKDDVRGMKENEFTMLVWPLSGQDPDDAFSGIPYEKGFNLLFRLESIVGTPAFEEFAKAYIQQFKYSTVTSGDFKNFFMSHFSGPSSFKETLDKLDWTELFYAKGMPSYVPNFSNSLGEAAAALADKWIKRSESSSSKSVDFSIVVSTIKK